MAFFCSLSRRLSASSQSELTCFTPACTSGRGLLHDTLLDGIQLVEELPFPQIEAPQRFPTRQRHIHHEPTSVTFGHQPLEFS